MDKKNSAQNSKAFLDFLNVTYAKLHERYESLFWVSYMGDHAHDDQMKAALVARDAFSSNSEYLEKVIAFKNDPKTSKVLKERLGYWQMYFERYQVPEELLALKKKIDALEGVIQKKKASEKEGYIDPKTKKFVKASKLKMWFAMNTEPDEKIRKAYFDAKEKAAVLYVDEYLELIKLRNVYARARGYKNFYEFKLALEEGMKLADLEKIFDDIYEKTKYAFSYARGLEKKQKRIRYSWNYGFMMSGSFTSEEEPYFPFSEVIPRWGESFAALGVDFNGGELVLDLLDREGKYNNGFCHYPKIVYGKDGKLLPGAAQFTSNVVLGQPGSAKDAYRTVFHEAGHGADRLNSHMPDACLNTEYPPASTAWAETQSMFLDTVVGSMEWRSRYAQNEKGEIYPFQLFERIVNKLRPLSPLGLMSILSISYLERKLYSEKNLTRKKMLAFTNLTSKKFFDRKNDSFSLLGTPHLYSWESACSYHGYGLAELALSQWRKYFYDKYGYIVDNPHVGKEMKKVWALASSHTYAEFVRIATGKPISAKAYIDSVTMSTKKFLALAKSRIERLAKVPRHKGPVKLGATIRLVHGKAEIANNKKSFEDMSARYKTWLAKHPSHPPAGGKK